MSDMVSNNLGELAALADVVAGDLDGALVALWKNNITPSRNSTLADLGEADYTGYAASAAVVWGAPFLNANGDGQVVGGNKQFQPTGTTTTCEVYGYWLEPTAGSTTPVLAVKFSSPVPMTGPLSALIVTPSFTMPQR